MDLNGDGHRDLITGSWPGPLYLFAGEKEGAFTKETTLKDKDGKEINLGKASVVHAVDWDRDDDLDLVVGDITGHVWFVANESGSKALKLGAGAKLSAGDKEILVPRGDSGPVVVDWDGNGTLDLIVGCGDGSVLYYANSARAGAPKLAAPATLVKAAKNAMEGGGGCGQRVKPHVVDWNGDGRLDLLLGDFRMTKPEPKELTPEEKKRLEELEAKQKELSGKMMPLYEALYAKVLKEMGIELEDRSKLGEIFQGMTPEQRKAYSEGMQKAMAESKEIKEHQAELTELFKEIRPLKNMPTAGGGVWVYLRSAEKPKADAPAPAGSQD